MKNKLLVLLLSFSLIIPYFASSAGKAYALSNVITVAAPSEDVTWPIIQPDSTGYLHFAWQQDSGIFYSRWNGDAWSSPLKISTNSTSMVAPGGRPSLTTDSTNNVYAVWDDIDATVVPNTERIDYRTRTPGNTGTWGTTQVLDLPSGTVVARNPNITIDGNGNPNVTYTGVYNSFQTQSIFWTRKVSGTWSAPVMVSVDQNGNQLFDPYYSRIKTDSLGNLHLVYWSGYGIFYREYNPNSQTWSAAFQLSNSGDAQYVSEAVTPGGQIFTAWFERSDTSIRERHTVSGVWQTESTLTSTVNIPSEETPVMGVTIDSKENGYVGWGDNGGVQGNPINLNYRQYSFASKTWGGVNTFQTGVVDAATPYVIADRFDNQHFIWAEKNAGTGLFELKYRVAEGTIQTVPTSGGTIQMLGTGRNYGNLVIPSGDLASPTTISIQIGPVPDTVSSTQVTIPRAFTYRPTGTTFSNPVTANLNYTIAEIGTADARLLRPWFWDSTANSGVGGWVAQTGATVSTSTQTISAPFSHFSVYGISAPIVDITWGDKPGIKPIGKDDVEYKFSLSYADGSTFLMPSSPDDLIINLKDPDGNILDTDKFQKGQMTFDSAKNQFHGKLHEKNLSGNYTLEVVLAGVPITSLPIVAR